MDLVDVKSEILANVMEFDSYRESRSQDEQQFYKERLRLGMIFVCLRHDGRLLFCPSRFAGYKANTMMKHIAFEYKHGSRTTPRLSSRLHMPHELNKEAEHGYLSLCRKMSIEPSSKTRTYWCVDSTNPTLSHPKTGAGSIFPDEVDSAGNYKEGAVKRVTVNGYERDLQARMACIRHYGADCSVCSFNFGSVYGSVGEGFIHVHHLTPLALRSAEYSVDPVGDLRPVCPNCHAMLHRSDPPFSIEEAREMLDR